VKRILVIKLSSLGDIAHALPAVRALKERTGAAVDWVVQPEYAPLLALCPDVDRLIEFPRRNWRRGWGAFWRELRRERYDWVGIFRGVQERAGGASGSRRAADGAGLGPRRLPVVYDVRPARKPGPRRHAVEELMDIVEMVAPGGDPAPPAPR
jgi:heptosyltransferase-1